VIAALPAFVLAELEQLLIEHFEAAVAHDAALNAMDLRETDVQTARYRVVNSSLIDFTAKHIVGYSICSAHRVKDPNCPRCRIVVREK
jgi:hypothetical protein